LNPEKKHVKSEPVVRKQTRGFAIAERPRDVLYQLKSSQLQRTDLHPASSKYWT